MREDILKWKHETGGSIWKPFLELFKTTVVTDDEFRFLINNSSENVARHESSHYDPVRRCLNSIHTKEPTQHIDIEKIDSAFLNSTRINFKAFLNRLELCPITEATFQKLLNSPNTTGDFDPHKQNIINLSRSIIEIANELHARTEKKHDLPLIKNHKTGETLDYDLEKLIDLSKNETRTTRLNRLQNAPRLAERIDITTVGFKRNPDVIVEVLERANGICERCKKEAPFIRKKDNTPYLEVHHKVMLSQGGEDTVKNAIALCPNCHRELHYG